jgi:hypothetical protein
MPDASPLKPNHKAIQQYYETLKAYREQNVTHEGAVETAFQRLLTDSEQANASPSTSTTKTAATAARTSPTGR